MSLGGGEVSQGTADIASRSVEALGGTFDYLTDDPAAERTYAASPAPPRCSRTGTAHYGKDRLGG